MITQESVEQLRRLMELREASDVAEKAAKKAKAEYRDAEAEVYEALEENPMKGTVKVDLGEPFGTVSFVPRETYYGRIVDDDKALDHYRQQGELPSVSAPKFVMARINEQVRAAIEQGDQMPPGVDYYARRGVTITRQKA